MKAKRLLISLLIVFTLMFALNNVFAYDSDARNISLAEQQIYDELISGNFLLNLRDAPLNLIFSSNYGEITLKQLLSNEGKSLDCESYNCTGIYTTYDTGSSTIRTNLTSKGVAYGLYFKGDSISATDFSMKVYSNFPESNSIPLSMKIGRDYLWNFDLSSEDNSHFRSSSLGCFNSNALLTNTEIDTEGYCEKMNLTSSKDYYLEANVSGSGFKRLIFYLVKDGSEIQNCEVAVDSASFNVPVGCRISFSESQPSGNYEACVRSSEANSAAYNIKMENVGVNCGRYSSGSNLADYSISVKVPYYSSSNGEILFGEEFGSSAVDSINSYLSSIYPDGCSAGCVVPIIFYGNNIEVILTNLNSAYASATGPLRSNKLYSLFEDVYRTDFSGIVSFSSFNWKIKEYGNVTLKIDLIGDGAVNNLLTKKFFVKSVPYATDVYPLNPPAGIAVYFNAVIGGNFSKIIWNFGDGSSPVETTTTYATHKFQNISESYNLTVKVFEGDTFIEKSFIMNTTSPETYVNESITLKRDMFNNLSRDVEKLPAGVKEFAKQKLQLNNIYSELTQVETERLQAISSEDFLNLISKIDSINVPYSVLESESRSGSLASTYSNIDPSLVEKIIPGNYSSLEKYTEPIFAWQLVNVDSRIVKKSFVVLERNGERKNLASYYEINLDSRSEEDSYLIIKKPLTALHFNSEVGLKELGSSASYVQISSSKETKFSFYVEDEEETKMFLSPSLEILHSTEDISVCEINDMCQKDKGENSKNCPQDCKAVFPVVLGIIGVLIFMLILYTILQIWYVIKYEQYLFKDRAYLFNLLAFINNSKLNGISRDGIYSMLLSKKWSREQIEYAIKKSEGKNTGMYELLPVQKIVAYYEMKKAKKIKEMKVAAPVSANLNNGQRPPFRPQPKRDITRV